MHMKWTIIIDNRCRRRDKDLLVESRYKLTLYCILLRKGISVVIYKKISFYIQNEKTSHNQGLLEPSHKTTEKLTSKISKI